MSNTEQTLVLMQAEVSRCFRCGSRYYTANVAFYLDKPSGLPVCSFCASDARTCPKIPQGYGVDPGDCACGNCPEARS